MTPLLLWFTGITAVTIAVAVAIPVATAAIATAITAAATTAIATASAIATTSPTTKTGLWFETEWIDQSRRLIPRVSIQVQSTAGAERIFADEPLQPRAL
jgi:hypothetical protein